MDENTMKPEFVTIPNEVVQQLDPVQPVQPKVYDRGALSAAISRFSSSSPGSPAKAISRNRATFEVSHLLCAPGAFDAPIQLTIASLTFEQELQAAKLSEGSAISIALLHAKLSVEAVNGQPLVAGEDEVLWELLGQGGREAVTSMYVELRDTESLESERGKTLASFRKI